MPFSLTDDQGRLVDEVRSLARTSLRPVAEGGTPGRVDRPLLARLGEIGLLARLFPADRSASALELCLLREALACESTEAETALALQGLGSYPILLSGSDAQVRRWIPGVARGEAVAAFALTEPEHGSDAGSLSLRAEPDGASWRLNGTKKWISNAPEADVNVVFARTAQGVGPRGVTAFVVPGDARGLSGRPLSMVAPHAIGELTFDGVSVSREDVLGEVDSGFKVAMRTLDLFRPSVGAFAVGMAQAALEAAVRYASDRRAFDRPIREFQAVSHTIAEMATRTRAARLMVYSAAEAYDAGAGDVSRTSAMAKLFATETAQWVVDSAVQMHGAVALEEGHLLERLYRDVRAPRIYEGTSEIQREVIARSLFA
jgi:acyl-CoA dehydrogenase